MNRLIFILLYFFTINVFVDATSSVTLGYPYNPRVDIELWDRANPYFLPDDHPIKTELDRIFLNHKKRVTKEKKTLKKAKFVTVREGSLRKPFVVAHPNLEGYLLKLYVDKQKIVKNERKLIDRIEGCEVVRDIIDKHGYRAIFKLPKKWIYPLPIDPSSPDKDKYPQKNFILVVEDMNILNHEENIARWRSEEMTPQLLDAIYRLLDEGGLYDSVFPFNLPFSRDGKIAVIDTKHKAPQK